MEENLEKKQAFLRQSILDKGYDADDFMAFLQEKKGEFGTDLNNWELNELISAVAEFTSLHTKLNNDQENNNNIEQINNNKNNDINNNNNENNIQNEYTILENNNNNNQQNNEIIPNKEKKINDEQNNTSFIKNIQTELTILSTSSNISINLGFPRKVEGWLIFSKSYVSYQITTLPFNFEVHRRYSDFEWLRNILSQLYINCILPPIPKKNFGDRFNENLISKRQRGLEKFLNGLIIHPLIKHSEILYDFLSNKNEEQFYNNKKKYDNNLNDLYIKNIYSYTYNLNKLKSLNGKAEVNINNEKETYFQNIKDNINLNIEQLSKLNKSYKSLFSLLDEVSKKYLEISNIYKELFNISEKYLDNNITLDTYNILSKIMKDFSDVSIKEKDLIKKEIKENFSFMKKEFNSMNDLIYNIENYKYNYYKNEDKLKSKKIQLFNGKDISKWELNPNEIIDKIQLINDKDYAFDKMLFKETNNLKDVKNYYGYFLNSLINEYERIKLKNSKENDKNIKSYCQKLSEIFADFHVNIADYLGYFENNNNDNINNKENNNNNNNKENNNINNDNNNENNDNNNNNDINNKESNNIINNNDKNNINNQNVNEYGIENLHERLKYIIKFNENEDVK